MHINNNKTVLLDLIRLRLGAEDFRGTSQLIPCALTEKTRLVIWLVGDCHSWSTPSVGVRINLRSSAQNNSIEVNARVAYTLPKLAVCGWRTDDTKILLRLCGWAARKLAFLRGNLQNHDGFSTPWTPQAPQIQVHYAYPLLLQQDTLSTEACTTWLHRLAATSDGSVATVTKSCAMCWPKYGAFTQT